MQLHPQVQSVFFMPSFVYVARVAHLSEKQAEDLRSAGFHVKSFGPGEITADDCLLVMTSEALLAYPYQTNSSPGAGTAEPGEKGHIPSMPEMPVPDMNEQLGSQAAIWHIIKTRANEAAAEREESSRRKPVAEPEIVELGLIPTAAGMRALSALRPESEAAAKPLPTGKNAPPGNAGKPHLSLPFLLGPDYLRNGETQRLKPWRPMATVATLLICASVLLTHRAATLPLTNAANESGRVDSDSASLAQAGSSHPTIRPSALSLSTGASRASTGGRRHPVDYDFVAEDFTIHFDAHGHNRATLQTPELKHNGSSRERKRVVDN